MLTTILALAAVASPSVEILAPGPLGELKGTLTRADPAAPVVLIIPGSGPTDRDGNSPLGISAAPYRLLADGLAANGVSSVRIDKRGLFGSSEAVPDANAVTIGDYVDDTHAWIRAIRKSTEADCVWVLGHSEGGLVALAAAQQEQLICGIILVAAPGRLLGDVIKEQLRDGGRRSLRSWDRAVPPDGKTDGGGAEAAGQRFWRRHQTTADRRRGAGLVVEPKTVGARRQAVV